LSARVRYGAILNRVHFPRWRPSRPPAVQQRVGHGKFSQYVTEAVTRQLEKDLLAELSELLAAEHGPVPAEYLAEAQAAWPDGG
jgi:hypothetical protein